MKCHYFNSDQCRSCTLLDQNYQTTIQNKEEELKKLFQAFSLQYLPSVKLDEVAHSRNKAKLAVIQKDQEYFFGFYDAHQNFVELEKCPLHMEGINELLNPLKSLLKQFNIPAYDLKSKTGELKYVLISKSASSEEILIRFVLRSKESLDRLRKMVTNIQAFNPKIKVITANLQPDHKAIFEGDEEIVLSKEEVTLHTYENVSLLLGSRSFFQVTPAIAQKLYMSVAQKIKELEIKNVLDLYCGVGAFSFFAAQSAREVVGVEISVKAIDFAHAALKINKIQGQLEFVAQDAEVFLDQFNKNIDALIVNPPRRGLNSQITKRISTLKPKYLFYSSCNVLSLKRDVEELQDFYQVQSAQIFDMFPFTEHFETLMILKLKE